MPDEWSGRTFLEIFQVDKETGGPKGIVSIVFDKSELATTLPKAEEDGLISLREAEE
ncbi:MAG TPA: hypothetical protein VFW40_13195 [Capsulimonadaceae bacterium]|nr:hypothetical protein [Capsulimonadaceae bacterium]